MKFAAMLEDVVHSLWRKPNTERVPSPAPPRLRGKLHWSPEGCTGCALCAKDCPAQALELIRLDTKGKRFLLRYAEDRCTFCGQCVENCRFGCLKMVGEEWSLAAPTREGFTIFYGDEADVRNYLAEASEEGDQEHGAQAENRGRGDRP